jgi:hypothetical protein
LIHGAGGDAGELAAVEAVLLGAVDAGVVVDLAAAVAGFAVVVPGFAAAVAGCGVVCALAAHAAVKINTKVRNRFSFMDRESPAVL